MFYKTIDQINIKKKIVILRIDGNVPFDSQDHITNDYRLQTIRPTLDYLVAAEATIILLTHRGRPDLTKALSSKQSLSNQKLLPWFIKHQYPVLFFEHITEGLSAAQEKRPQIILLENLRFFKEEKEKSIAWAKQFADNASIYINDGFGVMHREDTSVTTIPQLFSTKAIGFSVQKEINMLAKLTTKVEQPFLLILGGNKAEEKILLIKKMISKKIDARPSIILVGGKIGLYFLMALNKIEKNNESQSINLAHEILHFAKTKNVQIIPPIDHQRQDNEIIDIGPETIALFREYIKKAKTIFINGTIGIYEKKGGENGTIKTLHNIATSNAFSIIGGGNTVDALYRSGYQKGIDWISGGGGSTLAFLSSENPYLDLPGLAALSKIEEK